MSLSKSEIECVHNVLSLILKNLECPVCLELMKEPVSTICDHRFCRSCILKLFGKKKSNIQCPLCKNKLTKRGLQESTQFKQLAEGIVKTIHAFELDTGYEFSIDDVQKTASAEISAYRQLWIDDDCVQINNTPQEIVATGVSEYRTLNVETDSLTEFVRKVSTRSKRLKMDAPAYVEIEAENVSDYGSDASHTGDPFSPECEFLTTQQKNVMQNNIKKLEREMAILEAVLDQHGSLATEYLHSMNHREDCPESLQHEEKINSLLIEKVTPACPLDDAEILQTQSKCLPVTEALRPQQQLNTSITFTHGNKEKTNCPKSLMDLEIGQIPEGFQEMNGLLHQCQFKASSQREMKEPSIAEREKEIKDQADLESEENVVSDEKLLKDMLIQKLDNKGKEECNLVPAERTPGWHPRIVLQQAQGIAGSLSLPQPQNQRTNKQAMCKDFKQNSSSRASSPVFNKASNSTKSTVIAVQRKMSFVASGLNKREIQLVEAFARKMGAEFQSNFSPSTTHVVMKTDADFVCDRTLKYFMGIAGRRWVVSYQWIIECFREGSMIDELEFEVQGDVINGRNHNGPRKARKTVDGKLLLNGYEICCYGSFTEMNRDQLEWMIELCGASIIKEPCLFSYSPNCTEVVVVQPDANPINTDYKAIERQYNSIVVSREWILDSIARYEHHQLKDYQICLLD